MDDNFLPKEKLFRGIIPESMFINDDGTLTSAAFKDKAKNGTSVDREGDHSFNDAVLFAKSHLKKGFIVYIAVQNCTEISAVVIYKKLDDNPYHSEIYKNKDEEHLTKSQAKHLADIASRYIIT